MLTKYFSSFLFFFLSTQPQLNREPPIESMAFNGRSPFVKEHVFSQKRGGIVSIAAL